MDTLLKRCIDFKKIQRYVQENRGALPELIKKYYYQLGKNLGVEATINCPVFFEEEQIGSINVAWADGKQKIAGFNLELGNIDEFIASCYKLKKFNAVNSFLIYSGKSKNISKNTAENIFREMFAATNKGLAALIDIHKENCFILER